MRYRVEFSREFGGGERFIEAETFNVHAGYHLFYARRMGNIPGNDQWGNPRRIETQICVASFLGVQSVTEATEPEVAFRAGPFHDDEPFQITGRERLGRNPMSGGAIPIGGAADPWDNRDPE